MSSRMKSVENMMEFLNATGYFCETDIEYVLELVKKDQEPKPLVSCESYVGEIKERTERLSDDGLGRFVKNTIWTTQTKK